MDVPKIRYGNKEKWGKEKMDDKLTSMVFGWIGKKTDQIQSN